MFEQQKTKHKLY